MASAEFGGMQPPIMGFAWVDGLHLLHPDRLHIDGKGNLLYMLDWICKQLRRRDRDTINAHLLTVRVPNMPSQGLFTKRMTSTEQVTLAKALIVPLSPFMPGAASALTGAVLCQQQI